MVKITGMLDLVMVIHILGVAVGRQISAGIHGDGQLHHHHHHLVMEDHNLAHLTHLIPKDQHHNLLIQYQHLDNLNVLMVKQKVIIMRMMIVQEMELKVHQKMIKI